ncbi:MAG: hypothetical protein ACLU9S_08525 [Oscillospiraceae bacterium]
MQSPDPQTVFDAIIPEYLGGVAYGALCESVASELMPGGLPWMPPPRTPMR